MVISSKQRPTADLFKATHEWIILCFFSSISSAFQSPSSKRQNDSVSRVEYSMGEVTYFVAFIYMFECDYSLNIYIVFIFEIKLI
jgi:hypothetical protein